MMASGPPPISFSSYPQNSVRIPFEFSRIMDSCRVEVLKKFKKDIIDQVRFSDISSTLIACGLVSKDECFEICKLSVKRQMEQCFQKIHDIMDILVCQQDGAMKNKDNEGRTGNGQIEEPDRIKDDRHNGLVKNIWENFLLSLKKEHVPLATKIENELYKCAESKLVLKGSNNNIKTGSNGSIKGKSKAGGTKTKADIGVPSNFQHVKHYGPRSMLVYEGEKTEDFVFENMSNDDIMMVLEKNDPDLKEFFKRAGVEERHLNNLLTKQIIINFIAEHGGMDSIRREVRQHYKAATGQTSASTENPPKSDNHEPIHERHASFEQNSSTEFSHSQAPPPANVPFQPTPKPTPTNLYYF